MGLTDWAPTTGRAQGLVSKTPSGNFKHVSTEPTHTQQCECPEAESREGCGLNSGPRTVWRLVVRVLNLTRLRFY